MALFSKHCSSHYRHHMLLALSSLISASVHSHLVRDSERELRGGAWRRVCHEMRWRMIAERIAYLALIVSRRAFESTMTSTAAFCD